nr:type IV pilus biogenesis/stability protein PilW [Volucribacter amazonae]
MLMLGCVSYSTSPLTQEINKQQAAKARIELALGYLAQQDTQQAKINLDRAFAHAPNYYLVHSALAYFYQKQGEVAQAEQAYRTAIELDPKQGDSYNNYATFLCAQGRFEQAYAQFERALNSPHYYHQTDTYENLVLCSAAAKDKTRLQQYFTQLQQQDPQRANPLFPLLKKE